MRRSAATLLLAALAAPTGLAACSPAPSDPVAATATVTQTGRPDPGPVAAALALAPEDTAYLTVTDWARVKERLGAAELTSESIQTDRSEFWRAVGASTVLVTDGALRAENSRLGLRYGVTQDDVVWEVRWAGHAREDRDGGDDLAAAGTALRLRDDLDLDGLERAVADGVAGVEGAQVLPGERLLLRGAGEPGATLSRSAAVAAVLSEGVETQVVVPGCLGWPTALGADADVEDQEAAVGSVEVADLLEPQAWGIAFTGRDAVVRVVYPEGTQDPAAVADARARLELAEGWPTTEPVGWDDAFGLPPGLVGDGFLVTEEGGQVVVTADYRVVSPGAAATVALAGLVPWAVCSEVDWLPEPTGL